MRHTFERPERAQRAQHPIQLRHIHFLVAGRINDSPCNGRMRARERLEVSLAAAGRPASEQFASSSMFSRRLGGFSIGGCATENLYRFRRLKGIRADARSHVSTHAAVGAVGTPPADRTRSRAGGAHQAHADIRSSILAAAFSVANSTCLQTARKGGQLGAEIGSVSCEDDQDLPDDFDERQRRSIRRTGSTEQSRPRGKWKSGHPARPDPRAKVNASR